MILSEGIQGRAQCACAACGECRWRADVLKAADENHIWLNAFGCINPTDDFLKDVGRSVLRMLDSAETTHVSRTGYLLELPSQRELVVRINKS